MKARVDKEACIGCGVCACVCPEVFKCDEETEDKSEVISQEIPEELKGSTQEAAEACPTDAIIVE